MAEASKQNSIDYNDLELEVKQVKVNDGTNAVNIVKGGVESALSNDTIGTTAEDGYIVVEVNGTSYKIPFWADD